MQTQLTVLNNGLHVVSKKDETTGMFNHRRLVPLRVAF